MEITPASLPTFSQKLHTAIEEELPSFDQAFDTDSLRKFFKEHDSRLSTPSTTYSEAPFYEDLHLLTTSSKHIMESPVHTELHITNLNLLPEIEDPFNLKLGSMDEKNNLDRFTENKVMKIKEEREQTMKMEGGLPNTFLQMKIGDITQQLAFINTLNFGSDRMQILKGIGMTTEDQLKNRLSKDLSMKKKPVFIIERNTPVKKVIAKVEKEEKKPAVLVKNKKIQEEEKKEKKVQSEKKEQPEKEKVTKSISEKKEKSNKTASSTPTKSKKGNTSENKKKVN